MHLIQVSSSHGANLKTIYLLPASEGVQYETKWFYERARGTISARTDALDTLAKKEKQFEFQHAPGDKVVEKTDLWERIHTTWRGFPQIVSKGAQTNFNSFAEYIDEQWNTNEEQFNEGYVPNYGCVGILLFQYLREELIPKQPWYEGRDIDATSYITHWLQFREVLFA
ncbi:MAG: AIPR family protein [Streptococcus sp.]